MALMNRPQFRPHGSPVAAVLLAAFLCGGCASRFVTRTEYVAPGFSQASLHRRTVAVVPPADGSASAYAGEVAGVVRGMREAGARVVVLPPADGVPAPAQPVLGGRGFPRQPGLAGNVALLASVPDAGPDPREETVLRLGRDVDAKYLLVVRVTDSDVFRRYARRGGDDDGEVGARTSARRVGLKLSLLRLPDATPVWVASGSGEVWETRTGGPARAATVDDDLAAGNEHLYPPPPPANAVSARLTRRLLARVPSPTELEPN